MKLIPTIHFWATNFGLVVLILNIIFALWRVKKLPSFFQWFISLLVTAFIIQVAAKILWYRALNNLPLLHLFTLLEFIFISLFYRGLLEKINWKYLFWFIGGGVILIIFNSIFVQPLTSFNGIAKTFTQLAYISYGLLYFFSFERRQKSLWNLINSAILIYYSGSLFIFMFTNVLTGLKDFIPYYNYLWLVNVLLDLVFQLMVLYGLWKTGLQQTKYSP